MASKTDETNGGYDEGRLSKIFSKYGIVKTVVVSAKRKGSALVEFESRDAARMAVDLETGLPNNPVKLQWVGGGGGGGEPAAGSEGVGKAFETTMPQSVTSSERDLESLVVRKMRQAEERKRLIEQMQKEEDS